MRKWNDSAECDALEHVLAKALSGSRERMPAACPLCAHESVHVYLHARQGGGMGGSWVWCSSCRCFAHGAIRPPEWWTNLEGVEPADLTAAPEALDAKAARIDEHWNQAAWKRPLSPSTALSESAQAPGPVPGRR